MTAPRFIQRRPRIRARGFALVTTLIMVTLAAVIVVALLVNASLERTTATSYANRFSAELAVQNGLEAAKQALMGSPTAATSVTNDDTFLVLRADGTHTNPTTGVADAYYFLAKAQPGNANQVDCYPLFAGGTPTVLAIDLTKTPAVAAPTPPPSPLPSPAQETFGSTTKQYPTLLPFQQPAYTGWQEVRDPNDTAAAPAHNLPYQRYTFWVEDLGGYIDASVAGNTAGSGGGNQRPLDQSSAAKRYITSPAELAIFTIFNPSAPADPGDTDAKTLINNRALLFTQGTLKQLAPGAGSTDVTSPTLATRLGRDMEVPLVPLGYGYADEGNPAKPKLDINAEVSVGGDPAVQAIATKISDNLPMFASTRQGGLTGQSYLNTIAASMVDYADIDSDATVGPDYRGLDSYPLVSELYSMKWWTRAAYLNAATGTYFVSVQMDTWAELWNMTDRPVNGTCLLEMSENLPVQLGLYSYDFGIEPDHVGNSSTVTTSYPAATPGGGQSFTVNMAPNEYRTFHVRSDAFEFNTGVTPPFQPPRPSPSSAAPGLTGNSSSNYNLKWSGRSAPAPTIVVDHAAGGINRVGGKLDGYGQSTKRWSGGYPGFGYTDTVNGTSSTFNNPGDPRSSFYIQSGQVAIAYDQGSSFWERNNRSNIAASNIYKEVKPSAWPDGGHDSAIIGTAPGANKTTDPPLTAPPGVVTEPAKAPVVISNAGFYSTTAELGNIFDPGLWNVTTNGNNQWTDISTTSQSSAKYGGGYQLRIGRPEFTLFDHTGSRAWQLLDLFAVSPRVSTAGLVNVNTASYDVLRALGASVQLNRDAALVPTSLQNSLYPPSVAQQADRFANAVIAARPFLSPAQLSALPVANTSSSVFGDAGAWSGASQNAPTEWNDAGRKEYFAKVFPLAEVRSRNFRVFVTGESLDKSGNVVSRVNRVFQIFLNPARDSAGKITSQTATEKYEAPLPL